MRAFKRGMKHQNRTKNDEDIKRNAIFQCRWWWPWWGWTPWRPWKWRGSPATSSSISTTPWWILTKTGRFLDMGMDFVYPHYEESEELLPPVVLRGPEVLQRQGVQQQWHSCQHIVTLRELLLGQNIEGTSPLIAWKSKLSKSNQTEDNDNYVIRTKFSTFFWNALYKHHIYECIYPLFVTM